MQNISEKKKSLQRTNDDEALDVATAVEMRDIAIATPDPGIYYDLPAKTYHALDACSKSSLDWIADYSPMHLKWNREHPEEPTDALKFGSALHTMILEPAKFED